MPADYTYDVHKAIEAAQSRHRERDLGHLRALEGDEPSVGLLYRLAAGLSWLRPGAQDRPGPAHDAYQLTDTVCQLADGAMGRIAVRESNGEMVEVCVRA